MTEFECSICFDKYSGDCAKEPRVLNCGHSFCTICITSIIMNSEPSYCPTCRYEYTEKIKLDKTPINFSLLWAMDKNLSNNNNQTTNDQHEIYESMKSERSRLNSEISDVSSQIGQLEELVQIEKAKLKALNEILLEVNSQIFQIEKKVNIPKNTHSNNMYNNKINSSINNINISNSNKNFTQNNNNNINNNNNYLNNNNNININNRNDNLMDAFNNFNTQANLPIDNSLKTNIANNQQFNTNIFEFSDSNFNDKRKNNTADMLLFGINNNFTNNNTNVSFEDFVKNNNSSKQTDPFASIDIDPFK